MPAADRKVYSGWAYITRAEDVPGCWVAHCFDFGVVTIGDSPQHALEMVREAVGLVLVDDLNRGLDPHARRAPDEEWEPLFRLFEKHTAVPASSMDETPYSEFAVPLTVELVRRPKSLELVAARDLQQQALAEAAA